MGTLSAHHRHLDRMESAIYAARQGFLNRDSLEDDREVIRALVKALCRELEGLTETCTDENPGELAELALDHIDVAFLDAIDKRDDRATPESKAAYAADMARAMG